MCSTRWKAAVGSTTFASGGWTRVTSQQAPVPGWEKSTTGPSPKISPRSALFHSNVIATTARTLRTFRLQIYLARGGACERIDLFTAKLRGSSAIGGLALVLRPPIFYHRRHRVDFKLPVCA